MISSSDKIVQESHSSVGSLPAASSHDLTIQFRPNNLIKFSTTPARSPRQKPKNSDPTGQFTGGHPQCLLPSAFPTEDSSEGSPLGISNKLQPSSLPLDSGGPGVSPDSSEFTFKQWLEDVTPPAIYKDFPKVIPARPQPKKFTKHARQTLLEAGGSLDKEIASWTPDCGREKIAAADIGFFTATQPGSTPKAMEYLSRYSRYIVNLLKTFLRKKYRINLTINAWEWQKRGALHFHLIFVVPGRSAFIEHIGHELREKWLDYLDLIEQHSGVSMYARSFKNGGGQWDRRSKSVQNNCCKTIELDDRKGSSAAAYLSKYIGKSGFASQLSGTHAHDLYYPSSWWSVSKAMRILINLHSDSFNIRLPSSQALSYLLELSDLFSFEASLVLDAFNPIFAPDYTYRSVYIPSENYSEAIETMRVIIETLAKDIAKPCTDAFPRLLTFSYREWLGRDENHVMQGNFVTKFLTPNNAYLYECPLESLASDQVAKLEDLCKQYVLKCKFYNLYLTLYSPAPQDLPLDDFVHSTESDTAWNQILLRHAP